MSEQENTPTEEPELIDFNDPDLVITDEQATQPEKFIPIPEITENAKKRYKNSTGLPRVPEKYNTHVKPRLTTITSWKRDGLSNLQVAQNLGINNCTLKAYSLIYPELLEALSTGKKDFIAHVENAQAKSAMGFYVTVHHEKPGKDGNIIAWDDQQYFPPNPIAQKMILTNLVPEKWRDKVEQTTTHEFSIDRIMKEIGESQLQQKSKERELDPSKMVTLPPEPAKELQEPPE